jgi:S-DNA-T family DNA segregation ATPase FtsK/SpoIIIE
MTRAQESHPHSIHEALGLTLLGLGTLLFLALISYHPRDVPAWFPLHSFEPANRHTLNFIGPFGAIVASVAYSSLGAAAYLVAAVLLGCGGAKLLQPEWHLTRRMWWVVAFVLIGASLAEVLPFRMIDASGLNIASEGGLLGKWIGHAIFRAALGPFGAVFVLLLAYVVSLILMTGINPLEVVSAVVALPGRVQAQLYAWRMAHATEREQLALEAERIEKQRRKLERTLVRRGATPETAGERPRSTPAEPDLFIPVEEEPPRPVPQIIDANAMTSAKKEKAKKDSLAPMAAVQCENYTMPTLDLLDPLDTAGREAADPADLLRMQDVIIETLAQFSISVERGDITKGPTITRYEVYPAKGVRVDKIVSLERDLARATCAERINILAPIPGKDTVGIEIANTKKQKVTLRELLEEEAFHSSKARIPLALGKDVYGKPVIADLAAMPHLLVAGTTGSGKSVCINAIIASILFKFSPEHLRLIMIDPKVVEMQMYNTLPHLVVPVVTDPKKVLLALRWAVEEMDKRYEMFAKVGCRNIGVFNERPLPKSQAELDEIAVAKSAKSATEPPPELLSAAPLEPEPIDFAEMSDEELFKVQPPPRVAVPRDDELIIPDRMPYIVIIVDELADLMQTAPADVESAIARLTQKARAAGIHMIIATQTPRADVITGVIKANVPCRIAFQVSSPLDSRVILDENGAERLLGQGDLLYRPPGTAKMVRSQGVLVTDEEVHRIVDHASSQSAPQFENSIHERLSQSGPGEGEEVSAEDEELVDKCLEVMRQEKKASTSLFQRRLRLGYTRAARILDILEMRGYVAAGEGAKPREILKDLDAI